MSLQKHRNIWNITSSWHIWKKKSSFNYISHLIIYCDYCLDKPFDIQFTHIVRKLNVRWFFFFFIWLCFMVQKMLKPWWSYLLFLHHVSNTMNHIIFKQFNYHRMYLVSTSPKIIAIDYTNFQEHLTYFIHNLQFVWMFSLFESIFKCNHFLAFFYFLWHHLYKLLLIN